MKKVISMMVAAVLLLSSLSVCAYNVTMYAPDGRTARVDSSQVAAWERVGWYTTPPVTVYAPDGREAVIPKSQVEAWKNVGWYDYKPTVVMYAPDGRTASVPMWDVEAWKSVGWYTSKPIDVYSLDGRKLTIPEEHFYAYAQVGWYSEPVAKLYSKDGRTTIAPLKDVSEYRKVGWYPLHAFFFEANLSQIKRHFPLKFEQYYAGTRDSGDLPRNIYSSTSASSVKINFADFWTKTNECVWVEFKLKDVFPYLNLYADSNGRISKTNLQNALLFGIYSNNYISPLDYESPLYSRTFVYDNYNQHSDAYLCYYDYSQMVIEKDSYGYIYYNTADCSFNILT